MTLYGAPKRRFGLRAPLRVRLALVNGAVLGAVALLLLLVVALAGVPRTAAGIALVVLITAAGVATGYMVISRTLRPLRNVTATAHRLSGETLDQRIDYTGTDDEVAELASTFDAMLDRLSESFDGQKRFVANASHELRTPLAVMRTEIDVTMSDPDADIGEFRRMGVVVRDASSRMNALIESLLVLARSEAQAGRRLGRKVPADLAGGVKAALAATERECARLGLSIDQELAPAPVVGDPSLLDRLSGNLIENAVRYNHGQGRIWLRTGSEDGSSWLVVGNTGFDVDPADVPRLFEPFRRAVRDRTGSGRGAGLGLSIVRAVCDAHGGTVGAVALDGGGLEVTVRLPSADATPVATGSATVAPAAPAAPVPLVPGKPVDPAPDTPQAPEQPPE